MKVKIKILKKVDKNYIPVIAQKGKIYQGYKNWEGAIYSHDTVAEENGIDGVYIYGYKTKNGINWLNWEEAGNRYAYIDNPLELRKTEYKYNNEFRRYDEDK